MNLGAYRYENSKEILAEARAAMSMRDDFYPLLKTKRPISINLTANDFDLESLENILSIQSFPKGPQTSLLMKPKKGSRDPSSIPGQ